MGDWIKKSKWICHGGHLGEYRNHDIYVGNLVEAVYYPPASDKVEELMKAFEKTVKYKGKKILINCF